MEMASSTLPSLAVASASAFSRLTHILRQTLRRGLQALEAGFSFAAGKHGNCPEPQHLRIGVRTKLT